MLADKSHTTRSQSCTDSTGKSDSAQCQHQARCGSVCGGSVKAMSRGEPQMYWMYENSVCEKRLDIYWLNISGPIIGCPNILRLLRLRHSSYQPAYCGRRTVIRKLGGNEQTTQTRTEIRVFRLIYIRKKSYRVARKIFGCLSHYMHENLRTWHSL